MHLQFLPFSAYLNLITALGLGFLVTGCTFDSEVPSTVAIDCTVEADCPEGWTCRTKVGRCIPVDSNDLDDPVILDYAITTENGASVVGKGETLTLTFTVNEPLLLADEEGEANPLVRMNAESGWKTWQQESVSGEEEPTYTFTYTACCYGIEACTPENYDCAEDEGRDLNVQIIMKDRLYNEAVASGGTVKFDFSPPTVVNVSELVPARVRENGQASFEFSFDESVDLGSINIVANGLEGGAFEIESVAPATDNPVGDAGASELEGAVGSYRATFTAPADGAGEQDIDGTYPVTVTATDLFGNTSSPHELNDPLIIDNEPPELTDLKADNFSTYGTVGVDEELRVMGHTRAGQILRLTATFSEAPDDTASSLELKAECSDAQTCGTQAFTFTKARREDKFVFESEFTDGEGRLPDGTYELQLRNVRDVASNQTDVIELGSIVLDSTAPDLIGVVEPETKLYNANSTVVLSFEVNETLLVVKEGEEERTQIQATLNQDALFTCEEDDEANNHYVCTLALSTVSGLESGTMPVELRMTDLAENTAYVSIPIEFDPVAPQMESATSASFYNSSQTVSYQIQLTEPVFEGDALYIGPEKLVATATHDEDEELELTRTSHSETNWVYTAQLSNQTPDGIYGVDYANPSNFLPALRDAAGNNLVLETNTAQFEIDAQAPEIIFNQLDELQNNFATFEEIAFDLCVSEPVAPENITVDVQSERNTVTVTCIAETEENSNCWGFSQYACTAESVILDDPTADEAPFIPVLITVEDEARNINYTNSQLQIDDNPPNLISARTNLPKYKRDDDLSFTLSFDEALGAAPTVKVYRSSSEGGNEVEVEGFFTEEAYNFDQEDYFSLTLEAASSFGAGDDGDYRIEVTQVQDRAGNGAESTDDVCFEDTGCRFSVDATPPTVLAYNTGVLRKNSECESRSFLSDLQTYTASNQDVLLFAFQTDVPAADLATSLELDGLDDDLLDMPQNPDNALEDCLTDVGELLLNAGADAEHIAYFSFPVSSSTHADLEGAVNFSLDIKDNYSNGKTYNYPAVLDFTPPSLVGGGATKALYNAADVPQMSFNFSEPVFGEGICLAVECLNCTTSLPTTPVVTYVPLQCPNNRAGCTGFTLDAGKFPQDVTGTNNRPHGFIFGVTILSDHSVSEACDPKGGVRDQAGNSMAADIEIVRPMVDEDEDGNHDQEIDPDYNGNAVAFHWDRSAPTENQTKLWLDWAPMDEDYHALNAYATHDADPQNPVPGKTQFSRNPGFERIRIWYTNSENYAVGVSFSKPYGHGNITPTEVATINRSFTDSDPINGSNITRSFIQVCLAELGAAGGSTQPVGGEAPDSADAPGAAGGVGGGSPEGNSGHGPQPGNSNLTACGGLTCTCDKVLGVGNSDFFPTLTLVVADAAGNETKFSRDLHFDVVPPTALSDSLNADHVGLEDEVIYSVSFDEDLGELSQSPIPANAACEASGLKALCADAFYSKTDEDSEGTAIPMMHLALPISRTVAFKSVVAQNTAEGTYGLSLRAVDRVGNAQLFSVADLGKNFIVDRTSPTVQLTVNSANSDGNGNPIVSQQAPNNTFSLVVELSDKNWSFREHLLPNDDTQEVPDQVTLALDGKAYSGQKLSSELGCTFELGDSDRGAWVLTCSQLFTANFSEGSVPVAVTVQDAAGNATAEQASLIVDASAPAPIQVRITADALPCTGASPQGCDDREINSGLGQDVLISLTLDEKMHAFPTLQVLEYAEGNGKELTAGDDQTQGNLPFFIERPIENLAQQGATTFTWLHTGASSNETADKNGNYLLKFTLRDPLGNQAVEIGCADEGHQSGAACSQLEGSWDWLNIDYSAPTLGDLELLTNPNTARYSTNEAHRNIQFTWPEYADHTAEGSGYEVVAKLNDEVITVGNGRMTCAETQAEGCTLNLGEPAPNSTCSALGYLTDFCNQETFATLQVEVQDQVGNTTTQQKSIVIDFAAPELVNATLSPSAARLNETVVLSLFANEALGDSSVSITADCAGNTGTFAKKDDDNPNIYEATVEANTFCEGDYSFTATLHDATGNVAEEVPLDVQLYVDNSAPILEVVNRPSLESSETVFSKIEGFNTLSLILCSDEDVSSNLSVSLAGTDALVCLPGDSTESPCANAAHYDYECTYDLATYTGESGFTAAIINASDDAGNIAISDVTLEFDFEGPQLLYTNKLYEAWPKEGDLYLPLPNPQALTYGSNVRFDYLFDEPVVTGKSTATGHHPKATFQALARDGALKTINLAEIDLGNDAAASTNLIFKFVANCTELDGTFDFVGKNCPMRNTTDCDALGEAAPDNCDVCYNACLPAALNDGLYAPGLEVTDRAGNVSEIAAADCTDANQVGDCLQIDTEGAELESDNAGGNSNHYDMDLVKHLRVPWGALQTKYQPAQYVVPKGAGVAPNPAGASDPNLDYYEPEARSLPLSLSGDSQNNVSTERIEFYTGPANDAYAQLAGYLSNLNDEGTGWKIEPLLVADSDELWMGLVDQAGNRSAQKDQVGNRFAHRLLVHNVEWVATMGLKVAGSTFANPHDTDYAYYFLQSGEQIAGDSTANNNDMGQSIVSVTAQKDDNGTDGRSPISSTGGWSSLGGEAIEAPPCKFSEMVYDTLRGRTVLYCGDSGTVYERIFDAWREVPQLDPEYDGNPGPRKDFAMVYDPRTGKTLLHGGRTSGRYPVWENVIWHWDGVSWAKNDIQYELPKACWQFEDPKHGNEPVYDHPGLRGCIEPRFGHSMVYEPQSNTVVMYGGCLIGEGLPGSEGKCEREVSVCAEDTSQEVNQQVMWVLAKGVWTKAREDLKLPDPLYPEGVSALCACNHLNGTPLPNGINCPQAPSQVAPNYRPAARVFHSMVVKPTCTKDPNSVSPESCQDDPDTGIYLWGGSMYGQAPSNRLWHRPASGANWVPVNFGVGNSNDQMTDNDMGWGVGSLMYVLPPSTPTDTFSGLRFATFDHQSAATHFYRLTMSGNASQNPQYARVHLPAQTSEQIVLTNNAMAPPDNGGTNSCYDYSPPICTNGWPRTVYDPNDQQMLLLTPYPHDSYQSDVTRRFEMWRFKNTREPLETWSRLSPSGKLSKPGLLENWPKPDFGFSVGAHHDQDQQRMQLAIMGGFAVDTDFSQAECLCEDSQHPGPRAWFSNVEEGSPFCGLAENGLVFQEGTDWVRVPYPENPDWLPDLQNPWRQSYRIGGQVVWANTQYRDGFGNLVDVNGWVVSGGCTNLTKDEINNTEGETNNSCISTTHGYYCHTCPDDVVNDASYFEQHCSAEGGTGEGGGTTSFPTGVHILEMGGDQACVSHDTSSNGDPTNHRDVRNQQCWKDISGDPSQTAGTDFYQRMYHSMTRIPEASGAGEEKYDDLIIFGGQDRQGDVGNALYRRTLLSSGQWSWVSVTSANDGTGSGYSTDGRGGAFNESEEDEWLGGSGDFGDFGDGDAAMGGSTDPSQWPAARIEASLVWDAQSESLLLFGGWRGCKTQQECGAMSGAGGLFRDMWRFRFAAGSKTTGTWEQICADCAPGVKNENSEGGHTIEYPANAAFKGQHLMATANRKGQEVGIAWVQGGAVVRWIWDRGNETLNHDNKDTVSGGCIDNDFTVDADVFDCGYWEKDPDPRDLVQQGFLNPPLEEYGAFYDYEEQEICSYSKERLWRYGLPEAHVPSVLQTIDLQATGAVDSNLLREGVLAEAIIVNLRARGRTAYRAGVEQGGGTYEQQGYELQIWDGEKWAHHGLTVNVEDPSWAFTNARQKLEDDFSYPYGYGMSRLQPGGKIRTAVVPLAATGYGLPVEAPELEVDYMETRVRYDQCSRTDRELCCDDLRDNDQDGLLDGADPDCN